MPLILICGPPCCGKTTLANRLATVFEETRIFPAGVSTVSDENSYSAIGQSRDKIYADATSEKQMRGKLKDEVTRILSSQKLVVLDAQNYIKG